MIFVDITVLIIPNNPPIIADDIQISHSRFAVDRDFFLQHRISFKIMVLFSRQYHLNSPLYGSTENEKAPDFYSEAFSFS